MVFILVKENFIGLLGIFDFVKIEVPLVSPGVANQEIRDFRMLTFQFLDFLFVLMKMKTTNSFHAVTRATLIYGENFIGKWVFKNL